MRVCVVGAGSAIAQELIQHYQREDHEVISIRRGGIADAAARGSFESFDCLITLTGKVHDGLIRGLDTEDWNASIEDNLTSVFLAFKHLLPKVRDGGNVVVAGSIIGSTGGYGCAGYAAAKAGLVGLVRAAANENAARRVCVNLLELGYVDCGMGARLDPKIKEKILPTIPLGRFAKVGEVIESISYLAQVKYMTGNVLTFAGGAR